MDTHAMEHAQTRMLSDARADETVRVVRLLGGCGFKETLANLGVLPGTALRVLTGGASGPQLVLCRGCRIAIGRGMAERVEVVQATSRQA
ncbi:MAG TPA: ferrous iron transport protein A [Candidatus Hydrogenedentes bacterium]|nr:ferrous iron transport protein A [Candidatus Hydrogenedentota bacterium]